MELLLRKTDLFSVPFRFSPIPVPWRPDPESAMPEWRIERHPGVKRRPWNTMPTVPYPHRHGWETVPATPGLGHAEREEPWKLRIQDDV